MKKGRSYLVVCLDELSLFDLCRGRVREYGEKELLRQERANERTNDRKLLKLRETARHAEDLATVVREKMSTERSHGRSLLENVLREKSNAVMVAVKGLDKGFGRGGAWELGASSSSSSLSSLGGAAVAKIFSLDNSASSSSLSSSTLSHGRSSSSFTGSAASTSSAWREKDIGKGRESGGSPSYVQSPSSSIDLSSSSPSFKSSLSSNNSNYYGGGSRGSSQEPRESETGERERDTAAAEDKDAEESSSTRTAAAAQQETPTLEEDEDEEGMKPVTTTNNMSIAAKGGDLGAAFHISSNEDLAEEELARDEQRKMRSNSSSSAGGESATGLSKENGKDRGKKSNLRESGRRDSDIDSSGHLSVSRASNGSDSNESSCSSLGYGGSKPHKANDKRYIRVLGNWSVFLSLPFLLRSLEEDPL